MKILILSPYPESIISTVEKFGDNFLVCEDQINLDFVKKNSIEFIISYGYKFFIEKDIIEFLKYKIINLHISFLPFNRGMYPNLWSHIENTPSGISIHRINEEIDRGDILVQEKIFFDSKEISLRSSYFILRNKIELLLKKNWPKIKSGEIEGFQPKEGTFHYKKKEMILSK